MMLERRIVAINRVVSTNNARWKYGVKPTFYAGGNWTNQPTRIPRAVLNDPVRMRL